MESLNKSFREIERIMPGIKALPGYFRYNGWNAVKLAEWVERYQKLTKEYNTFVNFDTETTGLNPPEEFKAGLAGVTDIAVSTMPNGLYKGNPIDGLGNQSTESNPYEFESLSNPWVDIPDEVITLTGITNQMVQEAPAQRAVIDQFKAVTDDAIFVGHNIGDSLHNKRGYDLYNVVGPIYETYYDIETEELLARAIDTLPLFRFMIQGISHTNEDFCRMLGITLKGAHRAMPDVRVNAMAFSKLKPFLDHLDPKALKLYGEAMLKKERFKIIRVGQGGFYDHSWCRIRVKLMDYTYGRRSTYTTVNYKDGAFHFTETKTPEGKILSTQTVGKILRPKMLLRKTLIKEKVSSVKELKERYASPVYF